MKPLALLAFGAGFVPFALLVVVIVVLVAGRREPDPEHQRPPAIYYALVQFVTVFAVLFALAALAASLFQLGTSDNEFHDSRSFRVHRSVTEVRAVPPGYPAPSAVPGRTAPEPSGVIFERPVPRVYGNGNDNDAHWSDAVRAAIIALVAAATWLLHERRRPRFEPGTPGRRVQVTFMYAVCFVAVVTAVGAVVGMLFNGWNAIAPGVTGSGPREHSLRALGSTGVLFVLAAVVFWRHLTWAEPWRRRAVATPPPPQPWTPPAPPVAAPPRPAGPPSERPRPVGAKRPPVKRAAAPRRRSSE